MQLDNTPEEWEIIKQKFRELYLLTKSPDWTIEKQIAITDDINGLTKFK